MDNFKRSSSQRRRHKSSVDGFINSTSNSRGTGSPTTNGRPQRGMIGDFARKDGFHRKTSFQMTAPNHQAQKHRHEPHIDETVTVDLPPAPRRKRQHEHTKHKKHYVMRKALSTLMIVVLVGGGYLFGKAYLNILNIFRGGGSAVALNENVDPSTLRGEGDGRVNVLLLGRGGEGHEGVDLTDTIIVASIDPINKKAALLGIPRDLYVQPEGFGAMKINSVFFTGKNYDVREGEQPNDAGMRLLESTLEDTIGIPIHYHVLVDFEGFKKAIDTVGGVTIDVPEDLAVVDYMHYSGIPYTLNVGQGQQSFDGLRALMFSRTRKTSPNGDFDRSERQRLVMVALKDKVFSVGTYGNPLTINQLLSDLGEHITSNFTTEEVLRVYEIMQEVPNGNIASVGLGDDKQRLVTPTTIQTASGPLSIVMPTEGLFQFDAVKYFVRNALRDGFLESEDASVDVYNGTNIGGLAGRTADELKSYGYKVNTVADAPQKGNQDTILVDLTKGDKKYTKAYLENRFGVIAHSSMPAGSGIDPGMADFVIILGQNEENRLEN